VILFPRLLFLTPITEAVPLSLDLTVTAPAEEGPLVVQVTVLNVALEGVITGVRIDSPSTATCI
jgi:hypothetical protein